ncbi:MAG TPA: alpha/beta hydrolase [Nevskiaceae bacterium]|nr:alpha/beta hydrolase [Nevskiaceae bacterium]
MAYADLPGVRLAYQQLGEGPDLIFVHGLGANRAYWFPIALQLQARYRITLFDLRGHGYSSRPASGYRPQDFALDLLGLMDHLGIAEAALAGHSYGGAAALEAAVMAPARVRELALFDARIARLQPLMRLHDAPRISAVEHRLAAGLPALDWARLPQVGYLFLEAAARQCLAGVSLAGQAEAVPFGEGRGAQRAARAWLDLLEQTRAREQMDDPGASVEQLRSRLTQPVLLMYGGASRCRPSGLALQALLPQARYEEIAEAGHFFPTRQPERVLAGLRALLDTPALAA